MNIKVLSYDEHTRRRKAEPALKHDEHTDAGERWASARKALLDRLGVRWTNDPTEYGDGDFFIGEDWAGNRVLHVVVMKWEVLTANFLQECHRFLVPPYDGFLITVGKSMPAVEDMFQIVITNKAAYIRFYQKGADEARSKMDKDAHYGAVKTLVA
jgi:hypothetical protein